jgi:Immunity protein Imm1
MTNPLAVEWTSGDRAVRAEIKSWPEAEALLDRIGSGVEAPCLVEFYVPDSGQSLGLGIGRKMSVVTYQASLDPPYFISQGDKARAGTEWFCYGNEKTEYLAKNLVPMDQALLALKHFVESGTQPENLDWERL